MIFHRKFAEVLNGTKTETRRLVKEGRVNPYQVGLLYPVEGVENGEIIDYCNIEIKGVRKERACDISAESVKAEGFDTREEFLKVWEQIYGLGSTERDCSETELCLALRHRLGQNRSQPFLI